MRVEVRGAHSHSWRGLSPLLYVIVFSLLGVAFSISAYFSNQHILLSEQAVTPKIKPESVNSSWHEPLPLLPDVAITSIKPGVSAPVVSHIPTSQPVVFLGIDDGWEHLPEAQEWFTRARLPVSFFLTQDAVRGNQQYFRNLQTTGLNIQNHTVNHPHLPDLNRDQQKAEICGASSQFAADYGKQPTLFRPPYGQYNDDTYTVVAECGMKAIVTWMAYVEDGKMHYHKGIDKLYPGDIVLMHLKKSFTQDMAVFMDEANKQGLTVANLEDWLK